jgi:hypothetical protein
MPAVRTILTVETDPASRAMPSREAERVDAPFAALNRIIGGPRLRRRLRATNGGYELQLEPTDDRWETLLAAVAASLAAPLVAAPSG